MGKDKDRKRPLGIPTFEDKIVQRAVVMLLEPIYRQDFYHCSFGFRKQRSAHIALQNLRNHIMRGNEQYAGLNRKLRGHYAYFGITGNAKALGMIRHKVKIIWHPSSVLPVSTSNHEEPDALIALVLVCEG